MEFLIQINTISMGLSIYLKGSQFGISKLWYMYPKDRFYHNLISSVDPDEMLYYIFICVYLHSHEYVTSLKL